MTEEQMEVVRLHMRDTYDVAEHEWDEEELIEAIYELIAKNNEVLDPVSDCKKLNIHECLNDIERVIEIKTGVLDFIDKGSLRYQLKKAIDKMICCR